MSEKKRGRPPKTLSSSSKQTLSPKHDFVPLDHSLVQDRLLNLDGLDNLTSKKTSDLLRNLDAIKEKLKGKQVISVEEEVVPETQLDQPKSVEDPKTDIWRRGSFKYFNMWASDPDFKQIVQDAWEVDVDGYHMFRFSIKLKRVREALSQFNKNKFSNIDKKELALKDQLIEIQRKLQEDPGNSQIQRQEREIYLNYRDVSQKNFLFLKQKAKEKWIHEGDQNTAYFHKAIKARLYRNRVLKVTDTFGTVFSNSKDIQQAFLDYYVDLLNGNQKVWNCIF
ncbi:hypothetical protein RIF29_29905 [Crotalaria pallida]|uniref:RNA-directed DNA polymerase, eukaryota, reverse transcriptase zinc-binding domain protein n=1 Tax=Crotalaria pallida TaxID=3830 RepID=A0AAN9EKJ0_CROPI